MLKLLTSIAGLPVVAQREGQTIGHLAEAVFAPDKGVIIAYRVKGTSKQSYLSTVDILAYLDEAIVVADAEVLASDDDLVQVKRLGADKIKLLGLRVETDQSKRLGRVTDCLLETSSHLLAKVYIGRPFWQRPFSSDLIIPREQIVHITPRLMVVRYDVEAKAPEPEPEIAQ